MEKSELEKALNAMIKSGMDLSNYRRSPTKLIVSPYLLKIAESIAESGHNKHEVEVKFDE